MPLAFLFDENIPGRLGKAVERHNAQGLDTLDVVRVGEADDLPLSSDDARVLLWAERENRILVTEDKRTMPGHLEEHLKSEHHSPGILTIRPGAGIPILLEYLVLTAHAGDAREWENQVAYIPP